MRGKFVRRRWLAGAVAVSLVMAACGGDDSSGDAEVDPPGNGADAPDNGDDAPDDGNDVPDDGDDVPDDGDDAPDRSPGWAGELRVAQAEPATMDPARLPSESGNDWDRPAAIFDTLIRQKADGTYEGQLAESLETDDAVTWTLRLRPDVNFTDGTPLDADAVIFNVERQRDPENPFGGAGRWEDLASVTAVDELTVEFVLNEPNGTFWEGLASFNGFMGSPTAIQVDEEGFGSNPVGAGPYILREFSRDNFTLLERNPDYWDDTKPAFETIRIRMMPDPIAKAEALRAGEIDLAYSAGNATLVQLGDPEPYGLEIRPADGVSFVMFNHSRGPAQDIRVREAISLSVDPERVRDAVLGGFWDDLELVCPPFSPTDPVCLPGLWPSYDPERARELIDEYVAEGNSVDTALLAGEGVQGEAEFLQQSMNAIGMNVELDIRPGAEWLPMVSAGDFDMTWYAFAQPVHSRLFTHWRSDQRNLIQGEFPEYDEVVRVARTALDPDDQLEAWHRVQEIVTEEFFVGFYAPFRDGYILSEDLDVGDQSQGIILHLSEVHPR